jgi:hypothetical protein
MDHHKSAAIFATVPPGIMGAIVSTVWIATSMLQEHSDAPLACQLSTPNRSSVYNCSTEILQLIMKNAYIFLMICRTSPTCATCAPTPHFMHFLEPAYNIECYLCFWTPSIVAAMQQTGELPRSFFFRFQLPAWLRKTVRRFSMLPIEVSSTISIFTHTILVFAINFGVKSEASGVEAWKIVVKGCRKPSRCTTRRCSVQTPNNF